MRHVPPPEVLVRRLEEYRRHVRIVFTAIDELSVAPDEELVTRFAHHCESIQKWIDQITEVVRKRSTGAFSEGTWSERIEASLLRAVESLSSIDSNEFRSRPAEWRFERSTGELAVAAFLAFRYAVERLTAEVGHYDRELFGRIFTADTAWLPAEPQHLGSARNPSPSASAVSDAAPVDLS